MNNNVSFFPLFIHYLSPHETCSCCFIHTQWGFVLFLSGDWRRHSKAEDFHLRCHVQHKLLSPGGQQEAGGPGLPVHRQVKAQKYLFYKTKREENLQGLLWFEREEEERGFKRTTGGKYMIRNPHSMKSETWKMHLIGFTCPISAERIENFCILNLSSEQKRRRKKPKVYWVMSH